MRQMKSYVGPVVVVWLAVSFGAADVLGEVGYHIDEFMQFNGVARFTDGFDDGLEPPSGPVSGADYIVFGSFGADREAGGRLLLSPEDGVVQDGEVELVVAVGDGGFVFSSGAGGELRGGVRRWGWCDRGVGFRDRDR